MPNTKRRDAGSGSVFKAQNGRWVGFLDLGSGADGKRRRRKLTGRTKAEVVDKLRAAKRQAEDGLPLGNANDTVGALLKDFYARGLPGTCRTAKTKQGYQWAIEKHLVPALGARRLRDLSPDDVAAMLTGLADRGFSRASLVHLHSVLRRALRWGEARGRVARNVATLVDTPHAHRRVSKALTSDQARAVLRIAQVHRLEALWCIGLTVPSRPGELTGLRWQDVDLELGVLHFRVALHLNVESRRLELGELKTEQSRRSVEVPGFVIDALKRRKVAQAGERLALGGAWSNPDDLVFTTEAGTPIDPANLRRALRKLTREAGIPGTWTVYELRHSAVSILSAAGVPLELIADTAGHKNSQVTAVVYRHNLSPVIRSAKGPMEAALGPMATDLATGQGA